MPSYKPRITVYTDIETNEKLAYIAKQENRSSSNYTEYLIKKEINQYENQYGEIKLKTSNDIYQDELEMIKDPNIKRTKKLTDSFKKGFEFGNKKFDENQNKEQE